jgi:hypothetical protein
MLTFMQVYEAAKKALEEGRLQISSFAACSDRTCYYRKEVNGKTYVCAVGAAIPDDKYKEVWDEKSLGAVAILSDLSNEESLDISLVAQDDMYIRYIQQKHDDLVTDVAVMQHTENVDIDNFMSGIIDTFTHTLESVRAMYEKGVKLQLHLAGQRVTIAGE